MTRLLDEAIERARKLPDDRQVSAAEAPLAQIANERRRYRLTPEQVEEVKRIQQSLRSGASKPLPDDAMEAFWTSYGL